MERPYVICHILSALNGRISGPFMSTPAAYRRYLKRKGVSYIQAGEDSLDCGIALEKLFRLFGICKLLVCGGGMIDWTFFKAGGDRRTQPGIGAGGQRRKGGVCI